MCDISNGWYRAEDCICFKLPVNMSPIRATITQQDIDDFDNELLEEYKRTGKL